MSVRIEFKPQDLWIGAFWKVTGPKFYSGALNQDEYKVDLWVCLLPMVPIHFTWIRRAA